MCVLVIGEQRGKPPNSHYNRLFCCRQQIIEIDLHIFQVIHSRFFFRFTLSRGYRLCIQKKEKERRETDRQIQSAAIIERAKGTELGEIWCTLFL